MSCGCDNPCSTGSTNTAACESLPSQISNFSSQFFGIVTKTEVNGKVVWSLPCGLDVGLPNNPRSVDEGLACYFLRLFEDGILGLTGPQGDAGVPGIDGHNAYTVTLHTFTQPTAASPNIQVSSEYNPAIVVGEYVFIQASGWYLVTAVNGSGTLFLQLVQAVTGATGAITAGKLVIVTGPQGPSGTSIQGPQGNQGPQGVAGNTATNDNGYYFNTGGTDFNLTAVYSAVNFTSSAPTFLLPKVGKYMVTAVITLAGLGGVTTADAALLKFRNTSTNADVPGSIQNVTYLSPTQVTQLTINALVSTTAANQTLALFGRASGAGIISVVAANTTMTFVQLA